MRSLARTGAEAASGEEASLVERAASGDRGAFDALVRPHLGAVESLVRRMIGHPEDTRDLVQDALLRAFESVGSFRGQARFGTWLMAIAVRRCIDHLRARRRWRWDAQDRVRAHLYDTLGADGVRARFFPDDYRFDAREHIAFCFTCVGRSLPPLKQAALVLSDVLGLTDREAARALQVSESVLRHNLGQARREMHARYEGLCALVNKRGVCYQCRGLREQAVAERRGPPTPSLGGSETSPAEKRRLRLAIVGEADVHAGRMQAFHDELWRALERFASRERPE